MVKKVSGKFLAVVNEEFITKFEATLISLSVYLLGKCKAELARLSQLSCLDPLVEIKTEKAL